MPKGLKLLKTEHSHGLIQLYDIKRMALHPQFFYYNFSALLAQKYEKYF